MDGAGIAAVLNVPFAAVLYLLEMRACAKITNITQLSAVLFNVRNVIHLHMAKNPLLQKIRFTDCVEISEIFLYNMYINTLAFRKKFSKIHLDLNFRNILFVDKLHTLA